MTEPPLQRISVVVPCYHRARYLAVLLRSLSWSRLPRSSFEVIVVNDGGTDEVHAVVGFWADQGLDIRVVTTRDAGGPRNNAIARNAGLREARYPIILQTDPDIVFVSDVLRTAATRIEPGVFLSCGGYYPLTEEATAAVVFDAVAPSDDPEAYLARARGRPNQVYSPDGVGGLHGAFVCARQDLMEAGGYDESYAYWGWEDRELIVTLSDRGLVRRSIPEMVVVHLWHPVIRGELHREAYAVRGRLSRAAWDVQMQRVGAEYPRGRRPRVSRREKPNGDAEEFDLGAYRDWMRPEEQPVGTGLVAAGSGERIDQVLQPVPRAWQMFFDAHRLEAIELRAAGHVVLARALLRYVIRRPWELAGATALDWTTYTFALELDDDRGFVDPGLARYERVDLVLEALAGCEAQLGHLTGRDRVLGALSCRPDGPAAAAVIRMRSALMHGDLAGARRELPRLAAAVWTPSRAALAMETELLAGRPRAAFDVALRLADTGEPGDLFERMRLVEHLRLIERLDDSLGVWAPWPDLEWSFAARDDSEFVYSAAVRSRRDGLDLAACLLFDRFNLGASAADARLTASGITERRSALERITRMSDERTRAAAGYEWPFQYNVSKAAVVRSHP